MTWQRQATDVLGARIVPFLQLSFVSGKQYTIHTMSCELIPGVKVKWTKKKANQTPFKTLWPFSSTSLNLTEVPIPWVYEHLFPQSIAVLWQKLLNAQRNSSKDKRKLIPQCMAVRRTKYQCPDTKSCWSALGVALRKPELCALIDISLLLHKTNYLLPKQPELRQAY